MFNITKKKTKSNESESSTLTEKRPNTRSFNRLIHFCLYALVLVTPILFMSLTQDVREFNKQAFLFFVIVLMLCAWVIKILSTRHVSWVRTSLDYILLVYLLVYLGTSMFSIDRASSFLGYYGRFTGGFVSVLSLVILYFLLVNNVRSIKIVRRLADYFVASVGLVFVYSLLQLLGWFILPFEFTHNRGFNPIGSLVSLGIFTAVSLIFFQALMLMEEHKTVMKSVVFGVLTLIGLFILLLINAFVAWLVLALGLIAFLALAVSVVGQKQSAPNIWKPMIVLVIAVLFVSFKFLPTALNPRNLININLPVEIQLSNSTTWNMVKNSMSSGSKQLILGSGPGTTGIAFGEIKPEGLNKTIVWSLNFDRASSEVGNIAIETGLLGLLVFELASIMFLIYGLFFLLKQSHHSGWNYALAFFLLWLTLYISHFFYFFDTVAYVWFWLSWGVFMAIVNWKEGATDDASLSFNSSPRSTLSWMFVSLLVLAALLVGAFFEAAVYGAEVAYSAGITELNHDKPDFAKVSADFQRAVTLNPYRDVYYLAYGQNLIFQASEEGAKSTPDVQKIHDWMSDIIAAGRQATVVSPAKAANWSALAQFYTGISSIVGGTDKYIIDSWQQAINRDSKNPSLYIRLAQAYSNAATTIDPSIAGTGADGDNDGLSDTAEAKFGSDPKVADTNGNGVVDGDEVKAGFNPAGTGQLSSDVLTPYIKQDPTMLKAAETALNKSIELKPDIPDSYIALARVLEKSNKTKDAQKELDDAAKNFPDNPDILYEQGRVTFNQANYQAAEKIFNNVVAIVPKHANALYSLGLIYLQRGDKDLALSTFEKVREITGPNLDLEKQINNLKEAIVTPAPGPTKK